MFCMNMPEFELDNPNILTRLGETLILSCHIVNYCVCNLS